MIKVTMLLSDIQRVSFAIKSANTATRSRLREAIQETTEAVAGRARTNVPVSGANSRKAKGRPGPGELRETIRTAYSVNSLAGFVLAGYGKLARRSRATRAKKLGPMRLAAFQRQQKRLALKAQRELGVYAMVTNYGSPGRGIAGSRFIDRAKEAERAPHIARIQRALEQAMDAAARGIAA